MLSKQSGGLFITKDYKKREFFVKGRNPQRISTAIRLEDTDWIKAS